ncbi:MAG: PAS domain-containing protein [Actinomycetota bacterium]
MEAREANFEELLGDLDAVVWEYETDAEAYTYISASCERMLGYPRWRWTDDPGFWASILHPDDTDRVKRFYEAIEREPGHHRVEYRVITADDRQIWTRDTIHVIDRGPSRSRLVRGICIDITEHRRAVDALAEAEQRYRSLVEHLPGVVYVWSTEHDEHGEGLYIGPQLEELLGFTPAEWMADRELWERRMHPDDLDRVWNSTEGSERSDEPYELEYRMIARDGREVLVHDESYPVAWSEEGRATVWQGVVLDVTDRRRLEKERRTLLVQLVRTQEEERRRLGGDIHDDPIQKMIAVGMRLHTLRGRTHDPELDAGLEELAGKVTASVESLRSLLFELRPPALEKEGIAEAIRQYLELSSSTKGSVVTELLDRLGEEPPIEARAIAYRIAQEAVVNAGKHAGAAHLRVELSSHDCGFLTRIVDDGAGMPPDPATQPGHGGLASMRERAELAGGWLRVLSAPGQGTTVEFWLPLEQDAMRPNLPAPESDALGADTVAAHPSSAPTTTQDLGLVGRG